MHGNLLHFIINAIVLFHVGRILESFLGPVLFLLVFLICGTVGFSLSLLTNSMLAIGTSGALFGIVGAIIGILIAIPKRLFERNLLKSLSFFLGINLLLSLSVNIFVPDSVHIDMAAHVGSMLMGILCGVALTGEARVFSKPNTSESYSSIKSLRRLSMACAVAVFIFVSILSLKPTFLPSYHRIMGQRAFLDGHFEQAIKNGQWLIDHNKKNASGHMLLARANLGLGSNWTAEQHVGLAIKNWRRQGEEPIDMALASLSENVNFREALFADEIGNALLCKTVFNGAETKNHKNALNNCAWLLLTAQDKSVRNARLALRWAKQSLKLFKKTPNKVLHTFAEAYWQNGQATEAIATIDRVLTQAKGKLRANYVLEKQRFLKVFIRS